MFGRKNRFSLTKRLWLFLHNIEIWNWIYHNSWFMYPFWYDFESVSRTRAQINIKLRHFPVDSISCTILSVLCSFHVYFKNHNSHNNGTCLHKLLQQYENKYWVPSSTFETFSRRMNHNSVGEYAKNEQSQCNVKYGEKRVDKKTFVRLFPSRETRYIPDNMLNLRSMDTFTYIHPITETRQLLIQLDIIIMSIT